MSDQKDKKLIQDMMEELEIARAEIERLRAKEKILWDTRKVIERDMTRLSKSYNFDQAQIAQLKECVRDLADQIERQSSWLRRMSELKWNDESYAPNFKKDYGMNQELLEKHKTIIEKAR